MRPIALLFCLALTWPSVARADSPVSFRNDVMPTLSRAGCNSGPCHGNLNGKGGFKLSLRGENPDADFIALTRDLLNRRLDRQRPGESLLIAKAVMRVPHEGGQRFHRAGLEYQLLTKWIAQGAKKDRPSTPYPTALKVTPNEAVLLAPTEQVQLKVQATFSDGSKRDVTRLACFEPSNLLVRVEGTGTAVRQNYGESAILVRYLDQHAVVRLAFVPERKDYVWKAVPASNYIDRYIFAKLRTLRLMPSELSSDGEFLRRAYLDTIGILPTVKETRAFLADTRTDKRSRLIEALLKRNEFADFWALKWADLLRVEEKALDVRGVKLFHGWIRQAIIDGKPLNEFARELVAGRGSTYKKPAANYYRSLRDPHTRAEATAQVFLGLRIQCAKCHNHPFDRWTQTDYHRFAAFFNRIGYKILENNRKDRLDKHEFDGEQIVFLEREGEYKHPVSGENLTPRFPGGDVDKAAKSDRLTILADWVADPKNPYFARAQANRIWQHLLGRGLVDPGDDFRASNPPSHPELLDALAEDFAKHNFDLRQLVRTIMNSRTYQLSSIPNANNHEDEVNYSHALIRSLQAEQLLDAVAFATGVRPKFAGFPEGTRAGQLPGVGAQRKRGSSQSQGEKFLTVFGKPVRSLSCECERSEDSTLAQAFQLITGSVLQEMLEKSDNRLGKLLQNGTPNAEIIDELYLAALSRFPSTREKEKTLELLTRAKNRRVVLEDILWGLINAKEFLLRR